MQTETIKHKGFVEHSEDCSEDFYSLRQLYAMIVV